MIIYREQLGIASEVFIKHQASELQRYIPHVVCIRGVGKCYGKMPVTRLFGESPSRMAVAVRRTGRLLPDKVVQELAVCGPTVVHSHFGIDSILGLTLAQRLRVPLVATFHGYDALTPDRDLRGEGYAASLYVRRRDELARNCTRFIAVSKCVANAMLGLGFPPARIVQHYIGVDTDFFRPALRAEGPEPIVLFVGRLIASKGADHLVSAMGFVQSRHPAARLVLIGAGPEEARLRRLASATLRGTEFLGACNPDQVRAWLRKAAVVSVPSVPKPNGSVEALGLVFIEAQAAGVPVATFRTGGIAEAVVHGETGLLSAPGDWHDLGSNIELLLRNRELWNRCGAAGRRRACQVFSLKRQTEVLEEIYDDAVAAPVNRRT